MKVSLLVGAVAFALIGAASFLIYSPYRATREHSTSIALRQVLASYREHYGAYPTGDTHSILKALRGDNPEKITFIKFSNPNRFTTSGDVLDSWGTPIEIYISGNELLFRSAGKNKTFEQHDGKTGDDLFY